MVNLNPLIMVVLGLALLFLDKKWIFFNLLNLELTFFLKYGFGDSFRKRGLVKVIAAQCDIFKTTIGQVLLYFSTLSEDLLIPSMLSKISRIKCSISNDMTSS